MISACRRAWACLAVRRLPQDGACRMCLPVHCLHVQGVVCSAHSSLVRWPAVMQVACWQVEIWLAVINKPASRNHVCCLQPCNSASMAAGSPHAQHHHRWQPPCCRCHLCLLSPLHKQHCPRWRQQAWQRSLLCWHPCLRRLPWQPWAWLCSSWLVEVPRQLLPAAEPSPPAHSFLKATI